MEIDALKTSDTNDRAPFLTTTPRKGKLVCETFRGGIWDASEGGDALIQARVVRPPENVEEAEDRRRQLIR